MAAAPRRLERIAELQQYLRGRPEWRPIDVELGDLQLSLGEMAVAEASYQSAKNALASLDDYRRIVLAEGRIADILQARGDLDEALRIRTEEELPVYERLGDVRSLAIIQARIADILAALGRIYEALEVYEQDVLPARRTINNQKEVDWARGRIESLRSSRARSIGRSPRRG